MQKKPNYELGRGRSPPSRSASSNKSRPSERAQRKQQRQQQQVSPSRGRSASSNKSRGGGQFSHGSEPHAPASVDRRSNEDGQVVEEGCVPNLIPARFLRKELPSENNCSEKPVSSHQGSAPVRPPSRAAASDPPQAPHDSQDSHLKHAPTQPGIPPPASDRDRTGAGLRAVSSRDQASERARSYDLSPRSSSALPLSEEEEDLSPCPSLCESTLSRCFWQPGGGDDSRLKILKDRFGGQLVTRDRADQRCKQIFIRFFRAGVPRFDSGRNVSWINGVRFFRKVGRGTKSGEFLVGAKAMGHMCSWRGHTP